MNNISNKTILRGLVVALIAIGFTSCLDDLNLTPIDPDVVTSASVYEDPAAYKQVLAKTYAGLALTGQQGPAGAGDVGGIDEGESSYIRQTFYMQELTTDEAVIGWNDKTIKDFHNMSWAASDAFIAAMYYRIFYQISLCNEFLRETTSDKLNSRGHSDIQGEVDTYRAEVRFLRALSYWHALDFFGSVPFVTEDDPIGAFNPPQTDAQSLFNYVESELLAIESALMAPRSNEYARADQGAAWMLLAKLYLNAETYTGANRYSDCLTYCEKVIGGGYSLEPKYYDLFGADNDNSPELIFLVASDGKRSQTWGATTFLLHAPIGGSMNPADLGTNSGWGGLRTTSAFVNKFDDISGSTDQRANFHTDGQSLEITDIGVFESGYAIKKFHNTTRNGVQGSDGTFPDTDFPMFRLADAYLMYAEAVKRGGGGDESTALGYLNAIRERAYGGSTSGNISEYNLDFIIDERARELYWENHRRTDLRRFGLFTSSSYLWPWKGGVANGIGVDECRNVFPIPAADLTANPTLSQVGGAGCY